MNWIQQILGFILSLFGGHTTATTTGTTTGTTTLSNPTNPNATKKALCIGINDYIGTQNDLQGCINDANDWSNLLTNKYGFAIDQILLDSRATYSNVTNAMKNLIQNAKAGDSLVITYSGHGSTVMDTHGDEINGKDECICLYDKWLVDDEIKQILDQLPPQVSLTVIMDSCFSGTVTRDFLVAMNDMTFYSKPRYLPPKSDMECVMLDLIPSSGTFASPSREGANESEEMMNHILISGSLDSYSYDANFNGRANGALSYYAIKILKDNPLLTYNDFYAKLRSCLPSTQYPQSPTLEASTANKQKIMFS